MNFILCADLHLTQGEEKEYSFSVLEEIINLSIKEKCGALLLAGDIFDSWDDVELLHGDFSKALERLPRDCAVYYLPGNHEELRAKGNKKIDVFTFGRAHLLADKPFLLHELSEETELLAVPFQSDYSGYRNWNVPEKKKPLRILLAHGTVLGITYTGPNEDTNSVLDDDLFSWFKADIAAVGHLHVGALEHRGEVLIAYPGSARVWRQGETGKRSVLLGKTETFPPHLEPLTLTSAGEFRVVPVYVTPEGVLQLDLPQESSSADWLHLDVTGFVEQEPPVKEKLDKLCSELKKKHREANYNIEKLSVLEGVSTHPLAISFLRAWENAKPRYTGEEPGVYELARQQGLLELKDYLEGRK